MADNSTNEPAQVSRESLLENLRQINDIDERVNAAAGNKSAGRRAIANQLATQYSQVANPVSDQLSKFLDGLDQETLAGVFTKLIEDVKNQFAKSVDTFLDTKVETLPTAPPLSSEEAAELSDRRKTLVITHNALRTVLEMFHTEVSDIPEPKKRTGATGVRGPRPSSLIDWEIDDEDFKGKIAAVAEKLDFPGENLRNKAKAIRVWIEENVKDAEGKAIDMSNPPARMSFVAPNGATVVGTYDTAAVEADTDDEENGDDNE